MKKQNFEKFVAPISNFTEYLMLEKLLGKEQVDKLTEREYLGKIIIAAEYELKDIN